MKTANNLLLYLSTLILITNAAISQDVTKEYNYSTIVESDGYAEKKLDQDINKIREFAYNDAKRNILEKTMIHIKSYSKVENFKLEYDLIQSEAEGYLRILEKKDHGFTKTNKYHVWIKAEVIYQFDKTDVHQETKKSINAPLSIKIWTEKEKYLLNEKVKVFLLPNKDCFVKLIYQDAENNLLQIFPNQHKEDNLLVANRLYTIPDSSDSFELSVSSPFGLEKITVFASTSQLGDAHIDDHGIDFYKIKDSEKDYSYKTRGVKIVKKEFPAEFFQESYNIIISEK